MLVKTLEEVIREAREDLTTYRDILEISDRIKKVEPKKELSKPRKDFSTDVSSFKIGAKVLFQRGRLQKVSKNREVQVRGSTTSKMWSALSATKRDIMLINVLNLRPKMQKDR